MKHQMKGNNVAGVGNHGEHAHSCRSGSQNRRRTISLSITRSFRVGDYVALTATSRTQDSSYHPSRSTTASRYSCSDQSKDLRDVLEKGAHRRKAQRMPTLQRLAPRGRASEEVAMPPPRLAAHMPPDKELARLSATLFSIEIKNTPLPTGFHQPKFTPYDGKTDPYVHMSHFQ